MEIAEREIHLAVALTIATNLPVLPGVSPAFISSFQPAITRVSFTYVMLRFTLYGTCRSVKLKAAGMMNATHAR
jgi:hypothetical protein